jgi:phospholipase C
MSGSARRRIRVAPAARGATIETLLAMGISFGLGATAVLGTQFPLVAGSPPSSLALAVALGAVCQAVTGRLVPHRPALPLCTISTLAGAWTLCLLLALPFDILLPASLAAGAALSVAARRHSRPFKLTAVGTTVALSLMVSVVGAGAWSVNEPGSTDARMVAGSGIVISLDTHAFLIHQGAEILRNDGRTIIADFLASPDPRAPFTRDGTGHLTSTRQSYLWRMQLGARDADRVLKPQMPDHFFNWWTHSGKGLIAGPSAATFAEQQYEVAVKSWEAGQRSRAMYHLGAATHLVDDACTPPHASVLVPNHRAYENWMLERQETFAVERGGIYQSDFRVETGHGGPDWSSSHTRGWVDECAHRAAGLVVNTAQHPGGDQVTDRRYGNTGAHFGDAQRLTAGYIAFFFSTVGGP